MVSHAGFGYRKGWGGCFDCAALGGSVGLLVLSAVGVYVYGSSNAVRGGCFLFYFILLMLVTF